MSEPRSRLGVQHLNRAAQDSDDISRTRRRCLFGIPQPGRVASNELSSSLQASFPRSSMCIHSGRTWSICGRTSRGWTQRYRPTLTQFTLTRCVLLLRDHKRPLKSQIQVGQSGKPQQSNMHCMCTLHAICCVDFHT